MHIKNYALVVEYDPMTMVENVTKNLQQGWLPVGGVSIAREGASPGVKARTAYAQAMIKPLTQADITGQIVTSVNGHG